MNKIIPITDLRKTNEISSLCSKEDKPVIITKNGYADLVIMSSKVYEKLERKVPSEEQIKQDKFQPLEQDNCLGFIKVAACSFDVSINNVKKNINEIIEKSKIAYSNGSKIIVFPELSLTGYTCGDMFYQTTLLNQVEKELEYLLNKTKEIDAFIVVGAPLRKDGKLYNCGVALHKGNILGVVPKMFIPNYSEFYEQRYFEQPIMGNSYISLNGKSYPFGTRLLFKNLHYTDEVIGIEICEDLWMGVAPSTFHSLAGATIECNLSASNETLHKEYIRRDIVKVQSRKIKTGYIYSCASYFESTTDVVYSGHHIIAEPDGIISESELFDSSIIYGEIDLDRIISERVKNNSLEAYDDKKFLIIPFACRLSTPTLTRKYSKLPFVEEDENESIKMVKKAVKMQGYALARRMKHINCKSAVLGLSGGLDSTIALFGIVEAFDILGIDRKNIHTLTMPCFGTSERTKRNAIKLAEYFGVTLKEINIANSVIQHLKDIDHDINDRSVTYENAQARERTQILMDYSNKVNGLVIGTGDLSEIALGWSTYNGDHMSMYSINTTFTKTFIREMTRVLAKIHPQIEDVLLDILGTPISPELIPPKDGQISQLTEDLVGPYELHDFFLYHFIYHHMSVRKIYMIAKETFKYDYKEETIKKWLVTFIKRFFNNQFKRSCSPDGPKISEVSLGPRGDLKLPSDGSYLSFLEELE